MLILNDAVTLWIVKQFMWMRNVLLYETLPCILRCVLFWFFWLSFSISFFSQWATIPSLFDAFPSNIDRVLIAKSSNVFAFGDFNFNLKNSLTYHAKLIQNKLKLTFCTQSLNFSSPSKTLPNKDTITTIDDAILKYLEKEKSKLKRAYTTKYQSSKR